MRMVITRARRIGQRRGGLLIKTQARAARYPSPRVSLLYPRQDRGRSAAMLARGIRPADDPSSGR